MTTKHQEVVEVLCKYLAMELDGCLAGQGFSRPEDSLQYSRQADGGTQFLIMHFDLNPSSDPRAIALLLPQIRLVFPELNRRVLDMQDMMGDTPTLDDVNSAAISQQIQNAAPRHTRPAPWWFIYEYESASENLVSMREFVQQWTVPFLNRYTTLAALTEGYEERDECLPHDRRFWLFIAAAYTLLGQPTKAMEVLDTTFKRPGARRQYAKAFEYVGSLLASQES